MILFLFCFVFLRLYCYRVLMADLSDDMTDEDVSSVKFLIGNRLPRERMEKAKVRKLWLLLRFLL